jgi:hypothetical protein
LTLSFRIHRTGHLSCNVTSYLWFSFGSVPSREPHLRTDSWRFSAEINPISLRFEARSCRRPWRIRPVWNDARFGPAIFGRSYRTAFGDDEYPCQR